jgi:hypothetical protein
MPERVTVQGLAWCDPRVEISLRVGDELLRRTREADGDSGAWNLVALESADCAQHVSPSGVALTGGRNSFVLEHSAAHPNPRARAVPSIGMNDEWIAPPFAVRSARHRRVDSTFELGGHGKEALTPSGSGQCVVDEGIENGRERWRAEFRRQDSDYILGILTSEF